MGLERVRSDLKRLKKRLQRHFLKKCLFFYLLAKVQLGLVSQYGDLPGQEVVHQRLGLGILKQKRQICRSVQCLCFSFEHMKFEPDTFPRIVKLCLLIVPKGNRVRLYLIVN